jgi:putative phosphoesterase
MRILVFSDSHGEVRHMKQILGRAEVEAVLFLGDGIREFEALQEGYDGKAVFMAVRGNCDFLCDDPAERIFSYEGVRILMLHGHTRNVKYGTAALEAYARVQDVDLVLYGHTHRAEDRYLPAEEGRPLRLFNPGSIGACGREGPRFGYLDIRNGQIVSNCAVYEE